MIIINYKSYQRRNGWLLLIAATSFFSYVHKFVIIIIALSNNYVNVKSSVFNYNYNIHAHKKGQKAFISCWVLSPLLFLLFMFFKVTLVLLAVCFLVVNVKLSFSIRLRTFSKCHKRNELKT